MDLLEYQGKQLFARHGVPVSPGAPATTVEEALAAADEIGYPVVVKAQVLIGGGGEGGGGQPPRGPGGGGEHARARPRQGEHRPPPPAGGGGRSAGDAPHSHAGAPF